MQLRDLKKLKLCTIIVLIFIIWSYGSLMWSISEYAALVKAKYEIYELDGYFYALKPGVNFTNIKISKCTKFTKDNLGAIYFFDETSGLIHAAFWISFVFAFTFECLNVKNIINTIRNDINENSDEENGDFCDFCNQIISGTPCVRCVNGKREDIFAIYKLAIQFYFLPVTSIIWLTNFNNSCWYSNNVPDDFTNSIRSALLSNLMGVFLFSIFSIFLYNCCQSECCLEGCCSLCCAVTRTLSYSILLGATCIGIFFTVKLYIGNRVAGIVNGFITFKAISETLFKKCCKCKC
jgi:hypothetical protein